MTTLPQMQLAEQVLTVQLQEFLSYLDERELSPEEEHLEIQGFFESFLKNEQEQKEKINASCFYLTSLKKDIEYYKAQAKRFTAIARVIENRAESFEDYLIYMIEFKGGKYPTKDFPNLGLRQSPPSVEIDNNYTGDVPEFYLKARDLEDIVSKTLVGNDLKAGKELPFAKLVRKGKTLMGLK
jgi:hypothetical protein